MSYKENYRTPMFGGWPPAIKNLLIINGIMFLAELAFKAKFGIELDNKLGLHYPTSGNFAWYQVITHMFMHDPTNFLHIGMNMYALWLFGRPLENLWGFKRFLIYYFICGIGAAILQTLYTTYQIHAIESAIRNLNPENYHSILSHYSLNAPQASEDFYNSWLQNPNDPAYIPVGTNILNALKQSIIDGPLMGASGAVMGILLAFGMLFPNTELLLLFFPVPIKAKYVVIGYGLIELFSGVSQVSGDNVAHFAHLGGMLFGFILIKIWQRNRSRFY